MLGADLDKQNSLGQTALTVAISKMSWDTVAVLIENGAKADTKDRYGVDCKQLSKIKNYSNLEKLMNSQSSDDIYLNKFRIRLDYMSDVDYFCSLIK